MSVECGEHWFNPLTTQGKTSTTLVPPDNQDYLRTCCVLVGRGWPCACILHVLGFTRHIFDICLIGCGEGCFV